MEIIANILQLLIIIQLKCIEMLDRALSIIEHIILSAISVSWKLSQLKEKVVMLFFWLMRWADLCFGLLSLAVCRLIIMLDHPNIWRHFISRPLQKTNNHNFQVSIIPSTCLIHKQQSSSLYQRR